MLSIKSYKERINKAKILLAKEPNYRTTALLISTNPEVLKSNDTTYPYKENSDIFYFLGECPKNCTLLIRSDNATSFLFTPNLDKVKAVWDGPESNITKKLKALNITTIHFSHGESATKEILKNLSGVEKLYFHNTPNTSSQVVVQKLTHAAAHTLRGMPKSYEHSISLTSRLRLFKSKEEIDLIKQAAKITISSILSSLDVAEVGNPESVVAHTLEYYYKIQDGEVAFDSIVASGKSAATLHYTACNKIIKNNELLLIDCGASYKNYCADITRVFPISGSFTKIQREIYQTVLDSQKAVISKIKDGVKIKLLYDTALDILIDGLKKLKVLKGTHKNIIKNKLYQPYFPHSIGHSLGLDVHDVGDYRGNNEAVLKTGMVFTVEPGLYFAKKVGLVTEPCGVRIEDDVLVTKTGCQVLTSEIPKEVEEVERLMQRFEQN